LQSKPVGYIIILSKVDEEKTMTAKIRNINPDYGMDVEFDSVDEMINHVNTLATEMPGEFEHVDALNEGVDYEIIQEENMTLVILEDNCNGYGKEFAAYVGKNYPEISVDFRSRTSGVGGGLFDNDGNELDTPDLWSEFCRQ
jgi:hypothetical protein